MVTSAMSSKRHEGASAKLSPVREAARRLSAALGDNLLGVVLFGSRARSKGRFGQDWDVLVIVQDAPDHAFDRVEDMLRQGGFGFRPLVWKQAEFETRFPSIFLDIGTDGIVLRERDGFASKRLARIREIVKEAGLIRGRDLIWRWRQSPRGNWTVDWSGLHEQS